MNIKDIFTKNNIMFRPAEIPDTALFQSLPESIADYLICMGKTIKLHETEYGSAWTVLYNIEEIQNCQETICSKNNLLVIGSGLNGDLLTINLKNCHIGYIFHDDLWEENYDKMEGSSWEETLIKLRISTVNCHLELKPFFIWHLRMIPIP